MASAWPRRRHGGVAAGNGISGGNKQWQRSSAIKNREAAKSGSIVSRAQQTYRAAASPAPHIAIAK